ncbi:uncharacterized protein BDZ99DRAFT_437746 [Mytilinidion resinicola]|uniref:C2H2-type domain-containing protein n=1 Tax=Mytilinidion resinicola TaxID=574789 RepID=A0A6A6YWT1_9PEZI|nr:uncharacterized protein BDZ99DRAFT_437746 [Mytilinidion resinicola]KAF2812979.1 hypothetical protein BDZ99DRAFT_437746 [Mytilinidion resinicola]
MQNLIITHSDIRTFVKHYLSQRITVDTQAVERQFQRRALREEIKKRWEYEQPLRDVEQQIAGIEIKDVVQPQFAMLPAQKKLADAIMAPPGVTLEAEIRRRNRAIQAVTEYCGVEEGGMHAVRLQRSSGCITPPGKSKYVDLSAQALEAAKVSVYKETRPRICFVCLGKENLPTDVRIHLFYTSGDLSKHFKNKHLGIMRCDLCQVNLDDKMHWQRHAHEVHGTVS